VSTVDSFGAKSTLTVGSTDYEIFRIDAVAGSEKLPFSLKVLLENLLRTEDGANVTRAQIEALGATRLLMGVPLYALVLVFSWLVVRAVYPSSSRSGE
jgi:hypothetical protein